MRYKMAHDWMFKGRFSVSFELRVRTTTCFVTFKTPWSQNVPGYTTHYTVQQTIIKFYDSSHLKSSFIYERPKEFTTVDLYVQDWYNCKINDYSILFQKIFTINLNTTSVCGNCMVLSCHNLDLFDKMTMWLITKIWQLSIVNVTKITHFSHQWVRTLLQYENKGTK